MKRFLTTLLVLALLSASVLPVSAAHVSGDEAIAALETLGLVRGTGNGFEPERCPTRSEALVMLLRLLGLEEAALAERGACPFTDGGWAAPYQTYAKKAGLVTGVSETYFGSNEPVGVRDYLTMVLRALGYSDAGKDADFSWAESIAFADGIGLTHGEYRAADEFLREDLALVSYTALTLPVKGEGEMLIRTLYLVGVVSGTALRSTRLAYAANEPERRTLDAAEIHERCASAVFLAEIYDTEEHCEKGKRDANGSGFFVTADGVAVLCCHELDGRACTLVRTRDGRRFPVTEILSYDPFRDAAVVQVSRTDLEGRTLRFFPWLELGDADTLYHGAKIFTVSNPLGYEDCVSEGIVSNPCRQVDDPDYPLIQITAPISQGSSGGPVLNAYGEVVGFVFGAFVNGENMNLAVPINAIDPAVFVSEGVSQREMLETENAKKAAATLWTEQTELELRYEEETEILICGDYPGDLRVQYEITEGADCIDCAWGDFVTKSSVLLNVTGIADGEAEITVSYAGVEGNDFSLPIRVTVSGAPEEEISEETEP